MQTRELRNKPKGPGTQFEDLPDTWRCPRCKRKKEIFVPVEE